MNLHRLSAERFLVRLHEDEEDVEHAEDVNEEKEDNNNEQGDKARKDVIATEQSNTSAERAVVVQWFAML